VGRRSFFVVANEDAFAPRSHQPGADFGGELPGFFVSLFERSSRFIRQHAPWLAATILHNTPPRDFVARV